MGPPGGTKMNDQANIRPVTKRIELSDGSFFFSHTYQHKGWVYEEGLFGGSLKDQDGKNHYPFGMYPDSLKTAIKYIDTH